LGKAVDLKWVKPQGSLADLVRTRNAAWWLPCFLGLCSPSLVYSLFFSLCIFQLTCWAFILLSHSAAPFFSLYNLNPLLFRHSYYLIFLNTSFFIVYIPNSLLCLYSSLMIPPFFILFIP
jgi:hypothetical protein